jgi:hypothetical protein
MAIATVVLLFILFSSGNGQTSKHSHPHQPDAGTMPSLVEEERFHHKENPWLPPIHHLMSNEQYHGGTLFLQERNYQQLPQRSLQGGDYEDCPVCGEMKRVTLPDATVDVPTDGGSIMRLTCEELEEYGIIGNISSLLCPLVQPLVQDICGCEDMETESPSSIPSSSSSTEPPNPVTATEQSTSSGGTVPSTIFPLMWWMVLFVVSILWTRPLLD